MEEWKKLFPKDIVTNFEILNYNHAAEIITQTFSTEFTDIIQALRSLNITVAEIMKSGGNESPIPPKFNKILDPLGWREIKITGDLLIQFYPRKGDRKGVFSEKFESEKK